MQNRHDAILRAINSEPVGLNILSFPTHEAYQTTAFADMGHTFYLYQSNSIKKWNDKFRSLPKNHVLLDGSPDQIKPYMHFDLILSQNKFGQYQVAKAISDQLNIPIISVEHTLPMQQWSDDIREKMRNIRGDIDLFITEFQMEQWGWNADQCQLIPPGIDTHFFKPDDTKPKDGKVLTVVNDYINRDQFCGWSLYRRLTEKLHTNPLGDTKGFSEPAPSVQDLRSSYQSASVFLNTATWSTFPVTLLEAMACACPIVTTAFPSFSEAITDGYNGFCSNDEEYLKDKLNWCIDNPLEAKQLGENARKTVIDKYSLKQHQYNWEQIIQNAFGAVHT